MGVHALKQAMREVKESVDHAGRHLDIGMPTLFKKQQKRLKKMRKEFKEMDQKGAKAANQEAKARGVDKPYDLKDKKSLEGAGNEYFRDHALDDIIDIGKKALKELRSKGDLEDNLRDAAKKVVKGIDKHDLKLKLLRTYMLSAKEQITDHITGIPSDVAQSAATTIVYDVYIADTPAAEALTRDKFTEYVETGVEFGESAKDLPKPIEGPNL